LVPLLALIAGGEAGGGGTNTKTLQTLKVARCFRCVRVLRMITMFEDLYLIVSSFFLCLRPLAWTVLFISIIIFIFAAFAAELIGQSPEFAHLEESQASFISVIPAMFSLFRIMSLDEWHSIILPFVAEAAWAYVFFLLYICVSALALMNLVTAVVVETSVKKTQTEEGYLQQVYEQHVQSDVDLIKALFHAMDADGNGEVSREEFVARGGEVELLERIMRALEMDLDILFEVIEA